MPPKTSITLYGVNFQEGRYCHRSVTYQLGLLKKKKTHTFPPLELPCMKGSICGPLLIGHFFFSIWPQNTVVSFCRYNYETLP